MRHVSYLQVSQFLKYCLYCTILIVLFGMGFSSPDKSEKEESRLYIKEVTVYEKYVSIVYEINYPGFVELHLFDPEGDKIWINGEVADESGKNEYKIARDPMEEGKRYSFTLKYKGKDYTRGFTNELKVKKDS